MFRQWPKLDILVSAVAVSRPKLTMPVTAVAETGPKLTIPVSAVAETGPKLFFSHFRRRNRSRSRNSVGLYLRLLYSSTGVDFIVLYIKQCVSNE
jgi:hypothetical protein